MRRPSHPHSTVHSTQYSITPIPSVQSTVSYLTHLIQYTGSVVSSLDVSHDHDAQCRVLHLPPLLVVLLVCLMKNGPDSTKSDLVLSSLLFDLSLLIFVL